MTHDPTHDRDEERLAALLRAVDADLPPPDRERLDALRRESMDVFLSSDGMAPDSSVSTSAVSGTLPSVPDTFVNHSPLSRKQPMLSLTLRGVAVLSAAVAGVAVWLGTWLPGSISDAAPFSKVLADLRRADTLQLELVKDDRAVQILVRAPGLVRKEESPQRYEIAAGSRLWRIDESANTVTTGDSTWFLGPEQQIDLLGLLEVNVTDASALLTARPKSRAEYDGRECFVYQATLPSTGEPVAIEAFVDVATQRLAGIRACPVFPPGVAERVDMRCLGELRLIAMNVDIGEDKFVIAKSLTEDGRIGKVGDAQGIVGLRPMLARRWTPVCREMLLKPGDWLRTELRGANAVKVTLSSSVELTLGPATLVECVSPTQARLHTGEVQVRSTADTPAFELLAPRDGSRAFKPGEKQLVRVDRAEKLVDVPQTPIWLAGFEGATANESLGSLIVNLPDGRNEPLAVGYHKVNVEIRDQIARTTIEESFVNHTGGRLEGVFHFPLPQDASISGFGMWIGNDLIEADVVEKQRAREIYETILREKRDPGLLEWTGGNIFKARVFPIEANSEKRIKIVYTQVLPLRANRYRYSYGLHSELLRTRPLRELSLTVTVNSALPLKSVTCPTHSVRAQQTGHSAQVEFAAQEYTPTRDFEVVCEIDGRQSDVVVVPHRRGEDGYFLVQLTPPSPDGNWQRELLPDGKPLNLVLLCDTSGSMDQEKRRQQSEFVATVLSSLGDDDRFLLAAADVGTAWVSPEPMSPTAENVAKAKAFLDERLSLGWTNLDRAFDDVLKKAPAEAQIIYIGDGIVSAGDTDPAAFVKRFHAAVSDASKKRAFHAVTVGNSYESVVLKGIASIGGGSVRTISGEQTPQAVALELLNEIAQPGLRDLNVEFRGLKVAAVYPERLPNVPAGMQQILVGRYLPEGKNQQGEIVVTGQRGGEKVRYAARVSLPDTDEGNSFIPRLWARAHLDQLLAQGQSEAVKDQIITLSEEFHIITPYTSLLVLETDADRERFGVQRRYEMRDGERFFAEGRDNADYELLQQQMKRAGDWRLGLRRQVLQGLAGLGRNPQAFQQQVQVYDRLSRSKLNWNMPGSGPRAAGMAGQLGRTDDRFYAYSFAGGGDEWGAPAELAGVNGRLGEYDEFADFGRGDAAGISLGDALFDTDKSPGIEDLQELSLGLRDSGELQNVLWDVDDKRASERLEAEGLGFLPAVGEPQSAEWRGDLAVRGGSIAGKPRSNFAGAFGRGLSKSSGGLGGAFGGRSYYERPDYTSWLNMLFPSLPPAPGPVKPQKDPEGWSPEAIALSKSLLRIDTLGKLDGGVELRRNSESFDPRWNRRTSRTSALALYSPTAWLTRPLGPTDHTIIQFCNNKERGTCSLAHLLGRVRASVAQELAAPPLPLDDHSLTALHESYVGYLARVEPAGENRVLLILTLKDSTQEGRFTIDTARNVVVKHEWFNDGKSNGATTYDDFVELAGRWWAKKSTTIDSQGRKTAETTYDIRQLAKNDYDQRMTAELAARPLVQFLHLPFVRLKVARQKVADGSAGFDDRLTMILYNATLQQWDEMWRHVDGAEQLAADKPGVRWMRTVLLATIRRNDEARQRFLSEARQLAANRQQDEIYLTEFILGQTYSISGWTEYRDIVETLKPVYERQPAELEMMPQWQERLAQCLDGLQRHEESLALRRTRADAAPWQLDWQIDYARRLMQAGQIDAALARLQTELDRQIERTDYEDESIRSAIADVYRTHGRWADLLKFTSEWIARKPTSQSYNSAYAQHLSALVFNDQLDAANSLAEQWMKDARVEHKLTADERARLDTALNFAHGSAYNLSIQRMDERWFEPLADTARYFLKHPHHSDIASRAIGNHYFQQSDVADRLRGEFLKLLQTDLAQLTPAQINLLLGWTLSGRIEWMEPLAGRKQLDASEVPNDVWQKIAAELKPRWTAVADKDEKHQLSEALRTIYANRFAGTDLLPFLRERLAVAHADYKSTYVMALFDALLGVAWTDDIEQEAFDKLRELSDAKAPVDRLVAQLPALHRLVDAMLANRQSAAEKQMNDQGGQDELTRQQVAAKKTEFRKAAMNGVATRLAAEAKKEAGLLTPWLKIERTWLDVQLHQNLAQVEEQCWQILGEVPPNPANESDDDEDITEQEARQQFIDGLLKQRAFTTVMNLAVRRTAQAATIERVMKYIDAGIAHGGDVADAWRNTKFRLLIALDRPDDLDRVLREWVRTEPSTAPWRQMLARLVAERGQLDEAIQLFEACEKDKLLSSSDYRMLADWYLVSNSRAAYERSRIEAFKQMPENNLSNMFYQVRNRWSRRDLPLPSELDENTLFAMKALFEKSASPESYLWQLREIYAASRDFRLLQMLPDAVLGRSPQQIYAFLQNLHSQVLYELRNEATADEILARIRQIRTRLGERTTTDLRALDLMEAVVERKSSEVLNQPGPHVDACLAALQRAFDREWLDGEPVQMAAFLHNFGTLRHPKLIDEQLRELRELQRRTPAASRDHLQITNHLANLLFWSYGRRDEAIREMETEVRAYTAAHNGQWPHADNAILGSYISLYEGATRHALGETILKTYLAKPEHDEQAKWFKDRLFSLYNHALEHKGEVSLGSGTTLFKNILALELKELDSAPDESVRYHLVSRTVTTFDIAHRNKLEGVADALRTFAHTTMPAVLKRQQSQYRNTATAPLHVINEVLGPKGVLRYIVERMEQYPQRLEIAWDSSWNAFGYELARRREEAANAKLNYEDLKPRVLALVIRELKRDLRTGENRNRYIYHNDNSYFWKEKAADFAQAVEEVLAERRTSGRRAHAVANYLWSGLDLYDRPIEILLSAHKNGLLEESVQVQLVDWLHYRDRHAESIPLLEPLIALRADYMRYRTYLMIAYHRTQRPEQLAELVAQTHAYFHQGGRWTEGNIAQFARGCSSSNLMQRAVEYFNEAISLHQRSQNGRILGDGPLSELYHELAHAHSSLGQTKEAVDAASAAIICWTPQHTQRRQALDRLNQVLRDSKDLDAYIRHLDEESVKTGRDSPILRKAVGQTWQSRNEHAKAIVQLQLASELQPNDKEIHQALIACYDATQNSSAATKQLLKLIDLNRHDLALYQQLAERMKNDEAEAERAATSILEASPNESESHAALAELRQKQERWDEAIPHWQKVAELRRLEPTGLLKLAEAQIHEKQWNAAKISIEKLQRTEWPSRFSDVQNQTQTLEQRLPK